MSSEILKQVERARKAGYSPDEIADEIARQKGIDIGAARKSGYTSEAIIQEMAFPGSTDDRHVASPYNAALAGMPGWRRRLVPLGSALVDPISGVRQMFGGEAGRVEGEQAAEANRAIEERYPYARAGGKVAVTAPLTAFMPARLATAAGAAGLAGRAAFTGGTAAGIRAADPMAEDESRAVEAMKAGAVGVVAVPVIEGLVRGGSAAVRAAADKLRVRSAQTGAAPSGAATEQELIIALRQQGIDFARLDRGVRDELRKFTQDALRPESLSGDPLVRSARIEQRYGPEAALTRGQATRSTPQMLEEQQFGGQELMRRQAAQAAGLTRRLSDIATRGRVEPSVAGRSMRSATLAKQAEADRAVNQAYESAHESAGNLPVSSDEIARLVNENTGFPGADSVVSQLKRFGIKFDDTGAMLEGQQLTGRQLYQLRKLGGKMTQTKGVEGIGYDLKHAVDSEYAASGIDAYKKAVNLARAEFAEFGDRAAQQAIMGTYRGKGAEFNKGEGEIPKYVFSLSPEKIRDFRMFLARGNEPKLREFYKENPEITGLGVQAVNDLKSSAVQQLIDIAEVSAPTAEGGVSRTVTPESLVSAYNRLSGRGLRGRSAASEVDEKFKAILGPREFAELKQIMRDAEDMVVPGRAQMKGSADANTNLMRRFMSFAARYLDPTMLEVLASGKQVATGASAARSAQWNAAQEAAARKGPAISSQASGSTGRIGGTTAAMATGETR